MHTVLVATHVNAEREKVWSTIGDPSAISEWHPAIAKSALDGAHRTCTLADGAEIHEEIDEVDAEARSYTYRIAESPLPVDGYRSTIRVLEEGSGCVVEWSASFDVNAGPPADMVAMIQQVYQAGLGALRAKFSS